MTITQRNPVYDCPGCPGTVTFDGLSWQCADCGFAPNHGAD